MNLSLILKLLIENECTHIYLAGVLDKGWGAAGVFGVSTAVAEFD